MDITLDTSAMNTLTQHVIHLPGLFERARISALKSTGYFIRQELKLQVQTGKGWPDLHPMTRKFYHKRETKAFWFRRNKRSSALAWLAKFSRYRVTDDGTEAVIGFGKSGRFETGTINRFLMSVVKRAEKGEVIPVTTSMRRYFGATRKNNSKRQVPGKTFFPLKKETSRIIIPRRPVFQPVMQRTGPMVTPYFEDRFWKSLERYRKGIRIKPA